MAQANIKAVITADDKASGVLKDFGSNVDNHLTKKIAAGATIAGLATKAISSGFQAITGSMDDAIKRVDTLNNSSRTFANMGFKTDDVRKAMDGLDKSIRGLPTPLDEAVRGMTLIASATGDVGKSQKIFSALNDAVIGFGGNAEDAQRAVQQLSQDFAGGRITAETWNSMLDSGLGPTLAAMAKQMGITTQQLKEGLSKGSISVGQFQDALVSLDTKGGGGLKSLHQIAKDATSGIGTGMENAKTAITRGLAEIVKAFGASNISGGITAIGSAIEVLLKNIAGLITTIQNSGVITAFFGALQQAADFLKPSLDALWTTISTQLFPALKNLWEQVLAPLAPVIGVILTGAVWVLINVINIAAQTITVWANFVVAAKDTAVGAFNTVRDFVQKVVDKFNGLPQPVKDAFAKVGDSILTALGPLGSIIRKIDDLVGAIGRIQKDVKINFSISGTVKNALKDVAKSIPGLNLLASLPGFATGVQNFSGGMALVGERGPELVNLPRGSSVTPNNQLSQLTQPTTVNVTFSGIFTGNEAEMRKLADKVFRSASDVAGSKSMSLTEMYG